MVLFCKYNNSAIRRHYVFLSSHGMCLHLIGSQQMNFVIIKDNFNSLAHGLCAHKSSILNEFLLYS